MNDAKKSGLHDLRSKFATYENNRFKFSKTETLKTIVKFYIKTLLFLSRVWKSIIFRFCVLVFANVCLYFFLEHVSSYKRYLKLVLLLNMSVLFVFIPALYIIQGIYKNNIKNDEYGKSNRPYVITVFLTCIIFILIAISFYYVPYFFLTSTINVSKVQKFILLFMVVFLYAMLFLMMSPAILLIPIVQIFSDLNLIDTYIAVALAHCFFNLPIAIWILEGFISSVPAELDELARIDGYNLATYFRKILLPEIAPGIAVAAFFCFLFSWTEVILSNALTTIDVKPIGAIMSRVSSVFTANVPILSAAGVLTLIPGILIVILVRRHLTRGFSMGRVD